MNKNKLPSEIFDELTELHVKFVVESNLNKKVFDNFSQRVQEIKNNGHNVEYFEHYVKTYSELGNQY